MIIKTSFFDNNSVEVAKNLLGKKFIFNNGGKIFSGIINEVEAYRGEDDLASHASRGISDRNRPMFESFGNSYVYLIYGMYNCLNFTTENIGIPGAVLIRSLIPDQGIEYMKINRKIDNINNLTNGPGKLCQAFGIDRSYNDIKLIKQNGIYLEDIGYKIGKIFSGPRIGIQKGLDKNRRFWF